MTGAQVLIAALVQHGVDTIFGIPGTHNLSVYAAIAARGIRHVSPRHEQGAGYAADGYARVTGRPGVCLTTTGPAILNAATAAAQSYSDSVPVLFISPGMPLRHPGRGNGMLHEVKDQRAAMNAIVAFSHRVTSVAEIPIAVAQSFATMTQGRPRPVHLEIPLDLLDEIANVELVAPIPLRPRHPDPSLVDFAADVLAKAQRPLIIAGGGARRANVAELAERLVALVLSTAAGKGVMGEDHPLWIGAGLQHPSVAELAEDSDVVLVLGSELSPADLWLGPLTLPGTVIRVDVDPVAVVANTRPDIAIVADAQLTVAALIQRAAVGSGESAARAAELLAAVGGGEPAVRAAEPLAAVGGGESAVRAVEVRAGDGLVRAGLHTGKGVGRAQVWRERWRAQARAQGEPWLWMMPALAQAEVIAGDSAMACYYGAMSNVAIGQFLYPAGLGTLGYGLPAAIGAKVARPDTRVLALLGDGGVMFTIAEFAAAVELGLGLPLVVVDNGGYGEIRDEMTDRGEPVHAVGLGHPDFPALAVALGGYGLRADGPEQLADAISKAFVADRPTLIHVKENR